MTALITGASSGIGLEISKILSDKGYDLILVARRKDRLIKLQSELKTKSKIIAMDISTKENCQALYEMLKDDDIDILINNAGFGLCGEFIDTSLDRELDMIDLNIKSSHILSKLFLKKFHSNNKGYIMNVASAASFMPGPLMASYYATKSYVLSLTRAISKELKEKNSKVKICALCPGPTDTEFNQVANVSFGVKSVSAKEVAEYGIKKMLKGKTTIIPTFRMKLAIILAKFAPVKLICYFTYKIQKLKIK